MPHFDDRFFESHVMKITIAQGLNGGKRSRRTPGGCLARKNAKIPEVAKVNNYLLGHPYRLLWLFLFPLAKTQFPRTSPTENSSLGGFPGGLPIFAHMWLLYLAFTSSILVQFDSCQKSVLNLVFT
jgi:hypothetical protein